MNVLDKADQTRIIMEIDIEKSTAASSSMDFINITYDCFNSSSMEVHNATNVTICENHESPKTAWDIVGIVIVSIILGLMTLTTIVGEYYVPTNGTKHY